MIFVDTNVFMYAVGRPHPLRRPSQTFFEESAAEGRELVTSAEVLQELLHAYLPVGRLATFDAAVQLVDRSTRTVFPVEPEDVRLGRDLAATHPGLGARDLLHFACCLRRNVPELRTHERAFAAAFGEE